MHCTPAHMHASHRSWLENAVTHTVQVCIHDCRTEKGRLKPTTDPISERHLHQSHVHTCTTPEPSLRYSILAYIQQGLTATPSRLPPVEADEELLVTSNPHRPVGAGIVALVGDGGAVVCVYGSKANAKH